MSALKTLLPIMLFFVLLFPSRGEPATESNEEYLFKSVVEARLEERLNNALSEIAGTDKIIIIVNADVKMKKGKAARSRSKKNTLVLPGVPVKREIGKDKASAIDISGLPPSEITRLKVTVFIDDSVSDSLIDIMRDITIKAIGYNPDRGDVIELKKIELRAKGFRWVTIFHPPNLFWLIMVIVGSLLAVSAAAFLHNPYRLFSTAFKGVNWDAIRGTPQAESLALQRGGLAGPEAAAESDGVGGDKPAPFSFVRERTIPELFFLIKEKPALDVAIVLNYLAPEVASKLLEHFPEEKRAEISLTFSSIREVDAESVLEIEETLKARLAYVMGGESKIASILNLSSDKVRDKVMKHIEGADEEISAQLKKRVKSFEEILRDLPPQGIQILFRQVDPTMLALAIKSVPGDDIQKKVLDALSEGASERMQEEIKLSQPVSESRLRREKNNIISLVRRMVSSGMIEEVED
jgi:hypothetical protein